MKEKKLTTKQTMFVRHYLECFNATQAAIRAGYSEKSAGTIGAANMQKVAITNAIEIEVNNLAMGYQERLLALGELGRFAEKDGDKLKAIELLAKLDRNLTQQVDVTSNGETMGVMVYLPDNERD